MGNEQQPDPPEAIANVGRTKYNAARIYGRITAYGVTYIYEKKTDSLIREDLYHQYKQAKKLAAKG